MHPHDSSTAKTRILMLLFLPLVMGSCAGDNPTEPDPVEETRLSIGVVGGKQGINVIHGATATGHPTVRYLGLIDNKGARSFCPVDIPFTTKGVNGNPIDTATARAEVNGHTLTFLSKDGKFFYKDEKEEPKNGPEEHGCLKPGQRGSFDIDEVALKESFADFEFKICLKDNKEQCQRLCF